MIIGYNIKMMEKNNLPVTTVNTKDRYIICPDMTCDGFYDQHLRCTLTKTSIDMFPELNLKQCPHIDDAKLVVFCDNGHPMTHKLTTSVWSHSKCVTCGGISFSKMSDITWRIPLDKYNEFINLKFEKNGN
jgi:hypothetical protein